MNSQKSLPHNGAGQYPLEVTALAASMLGIAPQSGRNVILCGADELELFAENDPSTTIIAVYGDQPKQAYACRGAAYDRTDACLTLCAHTAARLRLLHPNVLLADSSEQALQAIDAFVMQKNATKPSALHMASSKATAPNPVSVPSCSPMTILLLTQDFKVGGLEQVVIDLAALAKSLGHRPIIGYAGMIDEVTREDVEKAGIQHARLPESFEDRKNFLRDNHISIVNAHYATFLAEECHDLDIPYLQTIHNMYLWLNETDVQYWQALDKLTSGYIAVSANAAMVADLRLGLPAEKMLIIPNGSAMQQQANPTAIPEEDDALRADLGIPKDGIVFVQVASFYPAKALWVTIDAFAKALETRQDIYLVLLGKHVDLAYSQRIYDKIHEYGIENNVKLPGYKKEVHRYLNLARAKLAPSFFEGWSLAINEALQLGVPVIATDVGGACEQFHGTNNILLPSFLKDVETLSAKDFFVALTDEQLHAKVYADLTAAILQMASQDKRTFKNQVLHILTTKKACTEHIKIMEHLVRGQSISQFINSLTIPQRQKTL